MLYYSSPMVLFVSCYTLQYLLFLSSGHIRMWPGILSVIAWLVLAFLRAIMFVNHWLQMWNSSTYYYRPALVNNIWGNFTIATYYNLASTDELFDVCIVYWCSLGSFKEHWLHHILIIRRYISHIPFVWWQFSVRYFHYLVVITNIAVP